MDRRSRPTRTNRVHDAQTRHARSLLASAGLVDAHADRVERCGSRARLVRGIPRGRGDDWAAGRRAGAGRRQDRRPAPTRGGAGIRHDLRVGCDRRRAVVRSPEGTWVEAFGQADPASGSPMKSTTSHASDRSRRRSPVARAAAHREWRPEPRRHHRRVRRRREGSDPAASFPGGVKGSLPARSLDRHESAKGDEQLDEPSEGHYAPDPLSDRRAGGLLLAFLATVILVLAVATAPLTTAESTSTRELSGSSVHANAVSRSLGER
jgi:hypothetical protein